MVVRHGPAYVPVLDRLERELQEEQQRTGHRDRAQRILTDLMRKGVKDVAVQ